LHALYNSAAVISWERALVYENCGIYGTVTFQKYGIYATSGKTVPIISPCMHEALKQLIFGSSATRAKSAIQWQYLTVMGN